MWPKPVRPRSGANSWPMWLFFDYMFSVSGNMSRLNATFSAFENYFNVSALFVASAQSVTDQPKKGVFVDTYSAAGRMAPMAA